MKQPCDETLIRTARTNAPCKPESKSWVLAAAILGSSMAFIDSTVVNVALPALQSTFHATVVEVQWVVESYGLFLSALILAGGALGDFLGRRFMLVLGTGIFGVASIACGISSNVEQLVIARSVQGIGAALLVPSSLAVISASFDDASRGQAIGTWSGFTAITTALGPVLGGWFIEHLSWHWVFFINPPFAAAVIAIAFWHIPETHSESPKNVDWAGASLTIVALGGLVYGFVESENMGWRSVAVAGSLIAGVACFIALVIVERRVKSPMIPLTLFKSPAFEGANLLTLFLYAALGIFFFLFPLDLIQVHRYSATATGAAAMPMILLMFFLSRWSGGLVTRYGSRTPLVIGPLIVAVGFLLFAAPWGGGSYWMTFFPAFVVLGLGMAVSVAPLTTVVMSSVEQNRVGAASGVNNAVARVAGVLAIAILGLVMVWWFSQRLNNAIANLGLAPDILRRIQSNTIRLAGLEVPSGVTSSGAAMIRAAINEAFLSGFSLIMLICSALSAAGAGVAIRMIPRRT